MALLFDTNILLYLLRDTSNEKKIKNIINPSQLPEFTSIVCVAELKSLAIQRNWSFERRKSLDYIFENQLYICDINDKEILNAYAEIDSFSQCKNPKYQTDFTARNMGKNDIWIAATAHVLGFKLTTTDNDFNHLKDTFINLSTFSF